MILSEMVPLIVFKLLIFKTNAGMSNCEERLRTQNELAQGPCWELSHDAIILARMLVVWIL